MAAVLIKSSRLFAEEVEDDQGQLDAFGGVDLDVERRQ
jgi:hypothetical protein